MSTEKLITSLADLQEAAQQAALHGLCAIRLQNGEQLLLVQPSAIAPAEGFHDVTDPEEKKIDLSCLRPGGKYFSVEQAREELKRRLVARGIQG